MKPRPAVKKTQSKPASQVADGGFTDKDVAVKLEDAKALRGSSSSKSKSMVIVIEDNDNNDNMDEGLPTASPPKRRSPVAPADERKSRSVGALPFWAQAKWDPIFVPTLLDLAGRYDAEDGGWEIEKNRDAFCLLLQDVADIVYPNVSYAVHPTSKMYDLVSDHDISLISALLTFQSGLSGHRRLAEALLDSCE